MTYFDCTADLVGQLNGNGQKGMLHMDAPPMSKISSPLVDCLIVDSVDAQCRINANRGPWQLFARAPLFTRDKDLSKL